MLRKLPRVFTEHWEESGGVPMKSSGEDFPPCSCYTYTYSQVTTNEYFLASSESLVLRSCSSRFWDGASFDLSQHLPLTWDFSSSGKWGVRILLSLGFQRWVGWKSGWSSAYHERWKEGCGKVPSSLMVCVHLSLRPPQREAWLT